MTKLFLLPYQAGKKRKLYIYTSKNLLYTKPLINKACTPQCNQICYYCEQLEPHRFD